MLEFIKFVADVISNSVGEVDFDWEVISNAVAVIELDWDIISNAGVVIWDWKVILDVTAVDDVWLNITWSFWFKIKPNISNNDAEIAMIIKIK